MTNTTLNLIRENIKKYRKLLNLTQNELSFKANISCDYLSEIERGKCIPSLKRLIKIAESLEIEPYKLFIQE